MLLASARLAALSLTVAALGVLPAPAHATARTALPAAAASTATPSTDARPTHRTLLAHTMRGRAALDAVGSDLSAVAAQNGVSRAHLSEVLTEDHTAWLSTEGRLYYQEDLPAQDAATDAPQTAQTTAVYPTAQTFALHSRPGAQRVIFLDFDGANVTGTGWNTSKGGSITDGSQVGLDNDGDPTTFSASEHGFVQEVWREVAETYSAFDVDVTTQDPGLAAITRSSSSDQTFGMRVVITSSATARQQACGSCLGVAYVGTFDNVDAAGYYQPAWVFAYSRTFDPMIIAQAAAHETGHTLGLSHDGTATASYYGGTSAWGPVMGSSMNRAVTQFSKGEYAGANNQQDDLAVITSNGLPLRADDHGDSTATADQLGQQAAYTASGVISTSADTDVFALSLPCTTTLTASATGIGAQTSLDASLQVLDANGAVVATSSPASTYAGSPPRSSGMDASVSVPNATGTYYLRVDGVGNGSATSGGWSDYGSLGQYTVRATGCGTTTPSTPPTTEPPTTQPPTTSTPTTPPPTTTPQRPSAPRIGGASSGSRGGPRTAIVRWGAPVSNGGAEIRGYQVRAYKIGRGSRVRAVYTTPRFGPATRAVSLTLGRGHYVFRVMAWNVAGTSPWSWTSAGVTAR